MQLLQRGRIVQLGPLADVIDAVKLYAIHVDQTWENMFRLFLSSCRNTNGSLGEPEMLWEYEPTGEYFHSFIESFQTSTSVSMNRKKYGEHRFSFF